MLKHLIVELSDCVVNLYADEGRLDALFKEAGKGKGQSLVGKYYYRKDPPHVPNGQYHLHIYERQYELFALNWDGTAHDASHGVVIPNRVMKALPDYFPTLTLPPDGKIATFDPSGLGLLVKIASIVQSSMPVLVELQNIARQIPVDQRQWPNP